MFGCFLGTENMEGCNNGKWFKWTMFLFGVVIACMFVTSEWQPADSLGPGFGGPNAADKRLPGSRDPNVVERRLPGFDGSKTADKRPGFEGVNVWNMNADNTKNAGNFPQGRLPVENFSPSINLASPNNENVVLNKNGNMKPLAKTANISADDSGKPKKKEHMKISESPECSADVLKFCSEKSNSNNFVVLDCLQDDEQTASNLSDACHHFLWNFKLKLTKESRFDDTSNEACASEFEKFPECKNVEQGEAIPCLIERYEEIKTKPCSIFLNKMASIIFSDYRFMSFFMKDCRKDINYFKCGRLEPLDGSDDAPHSQGKTVKCLNEHRKELTKLCKRALMKVAELQSDDFHLDRALYYACKGDRESLCPDVPAGGGAVFTCLFKHVGDSALSENCRVRLEERQRVIAEDVRAEKSFYGACKEDILVYRCMKKRLADEGDSDEDYSRSSILLCLEAVQSEKKSIKPECLQQMFELRSELMQDYKISPELVSACEVEIKAYCEGELKQGGNTLLCLMKKASRSRGTEKVVKFGSKCKTEVGKLLLIVNPGENIKLDTPLQKACRDVLNKACSHFHAGQGDMITCLLENLDHEGMTDECEDHLLVIQYFAARDFRLDFHLYNQCNNDAERLCHFTGFNDPVSMTPDQGTLVFSCLHRHLRSDDPTVAKLSRSCIHEIKRVMRERSTRISLMPDVEDWKTCLEDLSQHCSDNEELTEIGGEMECLQRKLEKLTDKCKAMVSNFTQEEAEDIEMDRILMKACTPMIKKFCSELLDSDATPNEVLDCLIEHKNHNDMNEKCAARIEHHQIISLKDFKFNMKFHEACQTAVARSCKNKKTKYDVIACLSEHVRNDSLLESPQRIDDRCKKRLKFELLQRGESINLDPELKDKCGTDMQDFCRDKRTGGGEIMECLRAHKKKISNPCLIVLFQRERDDAIFGDYTLLYVCKKMIREYCDLNGDEADIFNCLKSHRNNDSFDDQCRQIVLRRLVEKSRDIRLNPHLQKACKLDIPKFCAEMYNDAALKGGELEGQVIDCLKKIYASKTKTLTKDCEHEIQSWVKEAALNINLNPVLMKTCKIDIKYFCLDAIFNIKQVESNDTPEAYIVFGSGGVIECLKKNFKNLKDPHCKQILPQERDYSMVSSLERRLEHLWSNSRTNKELAYAIAESSIDVHVDPILNTACQHDLITNCRKVPQGQGRQMSCLLAYLEMEPSSLTWSCKYMLQNRKNLWESAAQVLEFVHCCKILPQERDYSKVSSLGEKSETLMEQSPR